MKVYRICLKKWSNQLTASGFPAHWNSKGIFVLYTAGSRALACLENVVHRSGEGLISNFKVMVIEIPDSIEVKTITNKDLPENWTKFEAYSDCQKIGDSWVKKGESLVLKVPSAIIQKEFNFLLNVNHPKMKEVTIKEIEDFTFDARIKKN